MIPTEHPEQKIQRELSKMDTVNPFWTVSGVTQCSISLNNLPLKPTKNLYHTPAAAAPAPLAAAATPGFGAASLAAATNPPAPPRLPPPPPRLLPRRR